MSDSILKIVCLIAVMFFIKFLFYDPHVIDQPPARELHNFYYTDEETCLSFVHLAEISKEQSEQTRVESEAKNITCQKKLNS